MIRKLEKLLLEKAIAQNLSLLPKQTKAIIENFYSREIKGIQEYGFENPVEKPDSLIAIKRLIKIKDLKKEISDEGDSAK